MTPNPNKLEIENKKMKDEMVQKKQQMQIDSREHQAKIAAINKIPTIGQGRIG